MIVAIEIEFEVEALGEDELELHDAEAGARQAAFDFLTFVEEVTRGRSKDTVEVHAEGFGMVRVTLKSDNL